MTQTGQDLDPELDRIERSIDIDAPAERVWSLVSMPGWWINEREIDPDQKTRVEGDLTVVVHPKYGEFRLQTLESDEPRHVVFRWVDNASEDAGTRVEFWIEDRPGGVNLRVVESGFTSLQKDREAIIDHVAGNTEGWEVELDAARRFLVGLPS
jgi:uncharacterized protein YndB with AHSA1/START domain